MQLMKRSAHIGTAFFLCLGLAIVPVSLRVAGVRLTFSPRLAAAIDVWGQITEAFGGSYQQVAQPELAAVKNPDGGLPESADELKERTELACAHAFEESAAPPSSAAYAGLRKADAARCLRSKVTRRGLARANLGELGIHVDAIEAAFERPAASFEPLSSFTFQADVQKSWLNATERQIRIRGLRSNGRIKDLEIPASLKVLIQIKSPVASRKAAECKVKTAMAAVRALDLQRARLMSVPSTSPDNCEL